MQTLRTELSQIFLIGRNLSPFAGLLSSVTRGVRGRAQQGTGNHSAETGKAINASIVQGCK
jgi:hypothetical protein